MAEQSQTLPKEFIPIILGASSETTKLAKQIYKSYNQVSHVFVFKSSYSPVLHSSIKEHVVPKSQDEKVLLQALLDFSEQVNYEKNHLCLFLCNQEFYYFLLNYKSILEPRFLLINVLNNT